MLVARALITDAYTTESEARPAMRTVPWDRRVTLQGRDSGAEPHLDVTH